MDKVKLAKISIFIMTFLILMGLMLLVYGFKTNLKYLKHKGEAKVILLENGSKVKSVSQFKDFILVHTTKDNENNIIIVDPKDSHIINNIKLVEEQKVAK